MTQLAHYSALPRFHVDGRIKLVLGALLTALVIAAAATSSYAVVWLNQVQHLTAASEPLFRAIDEASDAEREAALALRRYVRGGDAEDLARAVTARRQVAAALRVCPLGDLLLTMVVPCPMGAPTRAAFAELVKIGDRVFTLVAWQRARSGLAQHPASLAGFALAHHERTGEAPSLVAELTRHSDARERFREVLNRARNDFDARASRATAERVEELAARTALLGLLCAAAGLAFLILGAVALRRSVLAPISRLRRSLEDGTEAPAVALDGGGEVDALARAVSVVTTRLGEDRDRAREAREALEREVALRTAAVADANARLTTELRQRHEIEEELRRAKERAEAASRAKSQFLASISHELRTPLNAVIGFAQLLERQTFGPLGDGRYVQYAGDIESSGSHLLEMINDILDIARIEAGELVLALYRTELAPLVRAARRNCAERAKHKRITIESRLAEAPIALDLDRARVVQVLDELLDNAIKHTPEGGAVTVMVAALSEGGAEVVIADTGIGLAANDVATALALFEQVDASFARRHQGAGLGLPLSQRLVDLHGGTLSITGAPGAGTIVRLVWPAPAAEAAA